MSAHVSPLALGLLLVTACTPSGVLVSSNGSHRLSALDERSGIHVVLTSGVWESTPSDLPKHWTVLHALISNRGDRPILLAPGDFSLFDERGFQYSLLDVGAAFEAQVSTDGTFEEYARVIHRNYDPGGPVEFEPVLPPGRTEDHALPWGILDPGTQMRGFMFFEPIERSANAAILTWHVLDADHRRVVDLRFDLRVARPSA